MTMMTDRVKVYWDSCAWLGLINGEAEKAQALEHVWSKAQHGDVEIWTSALAIAEVYKVKCEGEKASLSPENDAKIDNMFDQDFVKVTQLDTEIARMAKALLRAHDKLKKPTDGIHLASAVYWNADQLHTYDGSDLLGLSIKRADGGDLTICKPDMLDGPDLFNTDAKMAE
jgi:predicted nucleic acid-binding protein